MAVSSSTMVNGSYALFSSCVAEGKVCITFSVQSLLTRMSGLWAGGSGSFLFLYNVVLGSWNEADWFFWGIGRVVGGDMILKVLTAKEQGWPGDVERVEVHNSALEH